MVFLGFDFEGLTVDEFFFIGGIPLLYNLLIYLVFSFLFYGGLGLRLEVEGEGGRLLYMGVFGGEVGVWLGVVAWVGDCGVVWIEGRLDEVGYFIKLCLPVRFSLNPSILFIMLITPHQFYKLIDIFLFLHELTPINIIIKYKLSHQSP